MPSAITRTWRSPTTLLLTLTFSTGLVDAVGYLGLDRVFAGNMTGNVVILGMATSGGTGLPVTGPLIALTAFMAGAAAGGRALRGTASGWTVRTRAIVGAVAVVLAAAGAVAVARGAQAGEGRGVAGLAVTGLLALGMGAQAAAARHVKVADVTTVVVTSTLTGLASDSWFGRHAEQPWARRAGAVALVLLGALAGALLLRIHLVAGIAASAALSVAVAAAGHPETATGPAAHLPRTPRPPHTDVAPHDSAWPVPDGSDAL
ncbi:YoaK family protein [Streptomyces sp. AD681]|uniref:YoaK family protein n=1 Tax=Streptomyces sp. AD681 TaxID=3019069 RepID=UPI0022F1D020|nr:YoaK family protein [Streptomyces sp. AD681]MDA5147530.1 YoaK family protein [Streptomyces sp. AD681]